MATSTQLRQRIAAGEWDPKLRALYGNTEQELCRQRARYCAALEQFELYFGPGRQVQVYSAVQNHIVRKQHLRLPEYPLP